jgi:hypothetical protein
MMMPRASNHKPPGKSAKLRPSSRRLKTGGTQILTTGLNQFPSCLTQRTPYSLLNQGFQFRAIGTGKPRDFRSIATMEAGGNSGLFPRSFRAISGQLPASCRPYSKCFPTNSDYDSI